MAQQTLSNGPTVDGNHLKTEINSQESPAKYSVEPPVTSPSPQPSGPFLIRPPLNRSDSRQNFQYRPPFPATNVPSGPQSIGPQVLSGYQATSPLNSGPQSIGPQVLSGPQSIGPQVLSGPQTIGPQVLSGPQPIGPQVLSGPQPIGQQVLSGPHQSVGPQILRQQQPVRPPVAAQPFVQRGPPLGPGGTAAPRLPPQGIINPAPNQQQRPVFRPQSPFPRPPLLAQRPQVFQQSSVPAYNRPRPGFEDPLNRSQTLDSSELDNPKHVEGSRSPSADQRPPSAASLGRSFSMSSSNPVLERKLTGSQESINISRQSSMENVYKKEEVVSSRPESRPESRPGSRMGKIMENEDRANRSRPESRGEMINGDFTSRSPLKESPNHVIQAPSPKKDEFGDESKKREMELKFAKFNKGDNDSGVDESTQGNDQSCNGDSRSPRKPNKSRTSSTTPTKGRSISRGSKTPSSLQSPDSAATTPGSASEKKKVPMNKIQVGSAPSPNLKVVKSKIGSLENAHYKPGGGKVKIESKKLDFKNAGSRIEAKNERYVPKGGERKIVSQKLEWHAKSKIGSLENAAHKPKGGDKKIESVKLNFKEKAAPKVGSKDNIKYHPGGGDVKIENKKIELHATSKVGSLDNVKHKPTGGEKKIFDDKDYLKQHKSDKSSVNQSLSGSQVQIKEEYTVIGSYARNLNSPLDTTRRILDTLDEDETCIFSRRYIRAGSTRARKGSRESPRPQWKF